MGSSEGPPGQLWSKQVSSCPVHMQCEYGNPAQVYPKTNQQLQAALDISELIWL